jgi:hypothetical protein
VSDEIAQARAQAAHCRRLAMSIDDRRAKGVLQQMAIEYDALAHRLEAARTASHS